MLPSLQSQAPALFWPWLGLTAFHMALAISASMAHGSENEQSPATTSGLAPIDPRCEYREDPLGIDITAPRLSWIVSSSRRGQRQTAYHILDRKSVV